MKLAKFEETLKKYRLISLDSMVFSYYFHGASLYSNLAEIIIRNLAEERILIITSVITYLENLSYPALEDNLDKVSFIKSFFLSQGNLNVINLSPEVADKAASLRRIYKLSSADAVQFATAQITKAEIFITNDKHFHKLLKKVDCPIIFMDQFI